MDGAKTSEFAVLVAVVAMVCLISFGAKDATAVVWPLAVTASAYILSRGLGKRA